MNTRKPFFRQWLRFLLLVLISIVTVFPFFWMIVSSLKSKNEIIAVRSLFPREFQWGNFIEVLTNSPIPLYIWNTLWTSLVIVGLQLLSGALLAYALVFLKFKGKGILFATIMGTYTVPSAATYIPSYIILSRLGLLNTLTGLILSSTVNIFGFFLLRQFFMQIPKGLVEAAKVDGAGHLRILREIIAPLTKPGFITFGLLSFISTYNSYMWPSLITNDKTKYLVSQGLRNYFIEGGAYGTEWDKVMAASTVIVFPLLIVFAFTQRWILNGVGGETGLKG
ncbi:carbohydrate ABC transporter permease [Streptococcus merionis]|uniref:carbohydrate ABC transporter permease n=1 Tax=Streptococcus merionis TaxID=400065 RepID=UPI0026E9B228|nr:carbohydrate ABC transporter permease [Streptococcus merionis]